jgi:hypothetical protein
VFLAANVHLGARSGTVLENCLQDLLQIIDRLNFDLGAQAGSSSFVNSNWDILVEQIVARHQIKLETGNIQLELVALALHSSESGCNDLWEDTPLAFLISVELRFFLAENSVGLAGTGLAIGEEHGIAAGSRDKFVYQRLNLVKNLLLSCLGLEHLFGELVLIFTLGEHVLRVKRDCVLAPLLNRFRHCLAILIVARAIVSCRSNPTVNSGLVA